MAFSLTYAFGSKGRHIRRIAHEARVFVGSRFRHLEPTPLRDYLFVQYFAIDCSLFSVFYNDAANHPLYSIHKKYANRLIDSTEFDYRHIGRAYAFGLLASEPVRDQTEDEMARRLGVLHTIAFIYDGTKPTDLWTSLVLKPDADITAVALCQEIARILQLDSRDKSAFSVDWLSLVPGILAGIRQFLGKEDCTKSITCIVESTDFGGRGS